MEYQVVVIVVVGGGGVGMTSNQAVMVEVQGVDRSVVEEVSEVMTVTGLGAKAVAMGMRRWWSVVVAVDELVGVEI